MPVPATRSDDYPLGRLFRLRNHGNNLPERFIRQAAQFLGGTVLDRVAHIDGGAGEAEGLRLRLECLLKYGRRHIDTRYTAGI